MSGWRASPPGPVSTVIFDIDGTLLDSATGIIAGFQHALRSVGFPAPDEETLRLDLGPPVGLIFTNLGLAEHRLEEAVSAYRTFYLEHGIQQAHAYDGVVEMLDALAPAVQLATATAKRTDVAQAIMAQHGLADHFQVINGADRAHPTKTETIAQTLLDLGSPEVSDVVMVGDRHSDIAAGRACGVRTVGVTWGYGTRAELITAEPDALIEHPVDMLSLVGLSD